ncbi:winged helix-turn-helix transcriptional regulator [Streptomyces macrosporus]|uniref:HTH hxlR-type domain-containing protein n=1 Tax=Streptomyces macrosporus TaxID=44032 RepID=A0ABP5WMT2_9ACTN
MAPDVRLVAHDVGRWATLVLRELAHGPHSFGDLGERLPEISAKVLAERLRTLERRGLVARDRLRAFPVRTRYRLTPAGRAVRPLLVELYRTGPAIEAAWDATTPAEPAVSGGDGAEPVR